MKLIIASNNAHKLIEIKQILAPYFEDIISLREAGINHETVEDGTTFTENAVKKAVEICRLSGCCALADDSGICVDYLNGAPGIFSARFSGEHGNDEANNRLLLEKLKNADNRAAHYACAIALAKPDGTVITSFGTVEGIIGYEEAGTNGFGYDPLFYPEKYGYERTMATLTAEEKDKISHRGEAIRLLAKELSAYEGK